MASVSDRRWAVREGVKVRTAYKGDNPWRLQWREHANGARARKTEHFATKAAADRRRAEIEHKLDKPVEDMLKRASARAEKSLQERNAAILLAFAEGASLREIGQAANMAHSAIKYIVDKAPNAEAVRAAREAQKARAREPQKQ